MTTHYRNPRRPKMTICGHDCTISGRTYSNVTNRLNNVNCQGCLNAIMSNKLMRERYVETVLGKSRILSSDEYIETGMNKK